MNYQLYLFSCLVKLYDKKFESLEYDLQYDLLPSMYAKFQESPQFLNSNIGEYEAIIAYMKEIFPVKEEQEPDHTTAVVISRELFLCDNQRHSHPVLSYDTVDTFLRKGSVEQMDILQRAAIDFNKKHANQNWEKKDFDETVLEWMEKNLYKY